MNYPSLIEIVTASHLSRYVQSQYPQRGGLMMVAPAGQLKSTSVEVLDHYPDAKVVSDLNVQTLIKLRDDIVSGEIQTLAFTDIEKLYKRHGAVASNIEGIIMALVEEGFRKASFQDQRMIAMPARCAVIGAMTLKCYEQHVTEWTDNGFARRFLFLHYHVENAWKLEEAIKQWKRYELDNTYSARVPADRQIPYIVTAKQQVIIERALKHQRSRLSPRIMLQKITAVLNWKFAKEPKRVEDILKALAEALGPNGAALEL